MCVFVRACVHVCVRTCVHAHVYIVFSSLAQHIRLAGSGHRLCLDDDHHRGAAYQKLDGKLSGDDMMVS